MKILITIPNVLSIYRLLMCPIILWLIYTGREKPFVILFVINLITDVLDGFIARRFNQQSAAGVLLDSWADIGSFIIAFTGISKFHSYLYTDYGWWLGLYIALYFGQMLFTKLKFGIWVAGWHAYSVKVTGYLQALFFVVLFTYGFVEWFFFLVMIAGYLSELELFALNYLCKQPIRNVKGLYWFLKGKNEHDN